MKRRAFGFTLVELMMSLVIFSVVSVVIGRLVYEGFVDFNASNNISEVDWSMNLALNRFYEEAHTLRSSADITTASASQFSFVNSSGSAVSYTYSGSSFLRNGVALASGVTGVSFAYLNSAGGAAGSASAVRYITLTLSMQSGSVSTQASLMAGTRGMT